ncbi:MAG: hypothetical protein GYA75_03985 [Bacteroidales bacterium]|nr:hypothetical protein [Bacteroidales bacterium]
MYEHKNHKLSKYLKVAGLITGIVGLLFFLVFYLIKRVTFTEGTKLPHIIDLMLLVGMAFIGCIIGFWHTGEAGIILIFSAVIFFLQFMGGHLSLSFGGFVYALPFILSGGLFLRSYFVANRLKNKK